MLAEQCSLRLGSRANTMKIGQACENGVTRGVGLRYALRIAGKATMIPKTKRLELGLVDRPHYAYGLRQRATIPHA
jgi:hypothetical protein